MFLFYFVNTFLFYFLIWKRENPLSVYHNLIAWCPRLR